MGQFTSGIRTALCRSRCSHPSTEVRLGVSLSHPCPGTHSSPPKEAPVLLDACLFAACVVRSESHLLSTLTSCSLVLPLRRCVSVGVDPLSSVAVWETARGDWTDGRVVVTAPSSTKPVRFCAYGPVKVRPVVLLVPFLACSACARLPAPIVPSILLPVLLLSSMHGISSYSLSLAALPPVVPLSFRRSTTL